MNLKPITIAGGGLAGLTLGLLLRRAGVPVTLHEAGNYPRHRVCGEFISGHGRTILEELNILPRDGSHHYIEQAEFYSEKKKIASWRLPCAALAISRYDLDALLADQFIQAGGTLHTNSRFQAPFKTEGVVFATGRQINVDQENWRYIGLKAHARSPHPMKNLQIHFGTDGYIGVSPLPGGLLNVCGLFRSREKIQNLKGQWQTMLKGPPDSPLFDTMKDAEFLPESFAAVAGLHFNQFHPDKETIRLGDAVGMIAPLTGNGMSIAFECARLAAPKILDYCNALRSWDETIELIAKSSQTTFTKRVTAARILQKLLLQRPTRTVLTPLFQRVPYFIRLMYYLTRN